jgi:hypothetical protein
MSKRELLNATQKAEIADLYRTGEYSQGDLGVMYVVSATTIRRTLYEFNLCTFNSEVTSKERSFLESIKAMHIDTVQQLRDVLRKGLQC